MKKKDIKLITEIYDNLYANDPKLIITHHGTSPNGAAKVVTYQGPVSEFDGNADFYEGDYDISNIENVFQGYDVSDESELEELQEYISPYTSDSVGGGIIDPESLSFNYIDGGKTLEVTLNDEEFLTFKLG